MEVKCGWSFVGFIWGGIHISDPLYLKEVPVRIMGW